MLFEKRLSVVLFLPHTSTLYATLSTMKRLGILACIVVASLSIFGGFLGSEKVFAGKYDIENSNLINEVTNIVTSSGSYTSIFDDAQKKEALREVGLLSELAKNFKEDGYNNLGAYQNGLLDTFRTQVLQPLRKSLPSSINTVPYSLGETITKLQAVITVDRTGLAESGYFETSGGGLTANTAENAKQEVQGRLDNDKKVPSLCSLIPMRIGDCINEGITWLIKNTLLQIAGFLVWLTANMFNYAVQIGILEFSKWAPPALYPIWILIRQIVSLVIVFAVLYLGCLYMLGDENGKFEKMIPWLVMFALFVNFSYPLARTAIDISNIISLKIYASAVGNGALTMDSAVSFSSNNAGSLIMDKLGLQGLVTSATSDGSEAGGVLGEVKSVPGALLAVVFVGYTAYIFFMVTLLLIVRTVALVFIIVASPLLLVDSVIPLLGEQAKKLRQIFIDQLLVGPIFMIMFALTLKFLNIFNVKGGIGDLATGPSTGSSIVTFFNLIMMLIMLHIMITVTKSTSGKLGEMGSAMLGTVGGFGVGTAFAGAGLLARQTIGRGAAAVQNSSWVKNNKDTIRGRAISASAGAISNSSLNMMKSGVVAGAMKNLGMGTGMGMGLGMGAQGGYVAAQKKRESYDREAREGMQMRHKESFTDAKGVFHRKGEVDTKETEEAKRRFDENRGKSLFLTKEQKQVIKDRTTKDDDERAMKSYTEEQNKLKTETERKNHFKQKEKELEEMLKTDPGMKNPKTQTLANLVAIIQKKNVEDDTIFQKELEEVMFAYKAKSGNPADQKKYLTSKSKKIQEAFAEKTREATTTTSAPQNPVTVGTEAPPIIDVTESRSTATIDTSELDAAGLVPKEGLPIPQVLATKTPVPASSYDTGGIKDVSFVERARMKRIAAQQLAQQKAMNQMNANQNKDDDAASSATPTSPKAPVNPPSTTTA